MAKRLKIFGITYLVGKISRSNFSFQGPLAEWVYVTAIFQVHWCYLRNPSKHCIGTQNIIHSVRFSQFIDIGLGRPLLLSQNKGHLGQNKGLLITVQFWGLYQALYILYCVYWRYSLIRIIKIFNRQRVRENDIRLSVLLTFRLSTFNTTFLCIFVFSLGLLLELQWPEVVSSFRKRSNLSLHICRPFFRKRCFAADGSPSIWHVGNTCFCWW